MKRTRKKEKPDLSRASQERELSGIPSEAAPPAQLKASRNIPDALGKGAREGQPFPMKEEPHSANPAQKQPQSIDQMMEEQSGTEVSGQSLDFSLRLGAGQSLYQQDGNRVHTGEKGLGVHISVNNWGFSVRFSPGLTITHDPGKWLPDVNVDLTGYSWNFNSQEMNASWNARRIVNWLGDPGEKIHSVMRENVLTKLPSRMFEPGYNPFEDPQLITDFQKLFEGQADTGMEVPEHSHASLSAGFALDEDLVTDAGGYDIRIPKGTRLRLRANAGGGLPENLADTSIDDLSLEFSGGDANVEFSILGENISALNIRRVVFRNGGDVSFEYSLITESLASLGKLLLMIGQLRTGQDLGVRNIDSRHEGLRKMVDEKLDESVEPMLKEMILEHKDRLPGIDLARVLGIS